MGLMDGMGGSFFKEMLKNALNVGDVFLKPFEGVEHEKFFIVAGMSAEKIYLCTVFINSNIHPSIQQKPHLLNLQVPLKKEDNPFLKYTSFANCSNPIPLDANLVLDKVVDGTCKVIGTLNAADLQNVRNALINSGLLTQDEIDLYFS